MSLRELIRAAFTSKASRARRYRAAIDSTAQCPADANALEAAAKHAVAQAMACLPQSKPKKGMPDKARFLGQLLESIAERLASHDHPQALAHCKTLAAAEIDNTQYLELYLTVFRIAHHRCLQEFEEFAQGKRHLILHISCKPRVARAEDSCASFVKAAAQDIGQLIVVGHGGSEYKFNKDRGVLEVPAPDNYEGLPEKVFTTFMLLSFFSDLRSILKVDDDHRLKDAHGMFRAFARIDKDMPIQLGKVIRKRSLGENERLWHIGKTENKSLGATPYTLLGSTKWIGGGFGYILNRSALDLMGWASIYFPGFIDSNLYEDMTVSELTSKFDGKLVRHKMSSFLTTTTDY